MTVAFCDQFILVLGGQFSPEYPNECIRELNNRNRNIYKKGIIDKRLETKLRDNYIEACRRSENLTLFNNPSTNMYSFIEELENANKGK